ncbi:glycerophosphoryl diester phosphodiesterase [Leptospira kobayashii]|uniref:Glycerophosphoryl diester phosphodiesterase n=1 Tax=Leptospira kobayashii TaxID=1917830 RepID=A0ABM7UNA8_9LEPT|nr:glycerophosphodiester phosphodiesterase [Leptospira kobayashii]BDA80618.1 glycerophosphoryl diester phosphodiesterase [Leptospira kobayashii]
MKFRFIFRYLSLFFIFLLLADCSSSAIKNAPLNGKIDWQGHRGARGLKPENTWPAFEEAIQHKMTTLELDTVLTKDKRIVIHHDSETNPVICQNSDGSSIKKTSLYNLTLTELQALDCGSKKNPSFPEQVAVPGTKLITIEDFFQKVSEAEKKAKQKFLFNIETKFPDDGSASDSIVEEHTNLLVSAIEKAKVTDRTTIQSFDMRTIPFAQKKNSKIKTSALFAPTYPQGFLMTIGFGNGYREDIIEKTKSLKANIISPYFLYVTPEFVKQAHDSQIEVIPWTVNNEKEVYRLLGCGVDGVISDYPNLLRKVADSNSR